MPHLVNNALRTKNMIALMKDMGIDVEIAKISCMDELVAVKAATQKDAATVAEQLQTLLETGGVKPVVKRMTIADLITAEIEAAPCSNPVMETNRRSCLAVLEVLKMTGLEFALDEQQEFLEVKLPSIIYAPLFGSMTYKHMSIAGDKIKFSIKELLKTYNKELVLIDGKSPLVLANSELFEKKKVFYSQKQISAEEVEYTPHIFIPISAKPPEYHFALDTSESMGVKDKQTKVSPLEVMQYGAIKLAEALFKFRPDAVVIIKEFHTEIETVGSYTKETFFKLRRDVQNLVADGDTCLFNITLDEVSSIAKSQKHNNVLLFTDGRNNIGNGSALTEQLVTTVESLQKGSPLIPARNKFFIISYDQDQPDVLHQVARAFNSLVIKANSPDFVAALSESQKLQEWAAARELFTCRLDVTSARSDSASEEYVRTYDMCGQFVALAPKRCKTDETLHLKVVDGNGVTLIEDHKPPAQKPVATPVLASGSAEAATILGVFNLNGRGEKLEEKKEQNSAVYS